MAYDPMEGFQIGQAIGKSKRSTFGGTAEHMSNLATERDKSSKKIDPITLLMFKNAFPSEKDKAQTELNQVAADVLSGSPLSESSGSQFSPEDYIEEPVMKSVRGVPFQTTQKKLKEPVGESSMNIIRSGRESSTLLNRNLGLLTEDISKRMGIFSPQAWGGDFGSNLLNIQSMLGDKGAPDFASFKSQTDVAFAKYRKFITGVQAAFPEIKMLQPDFPQPWDTPDIYKAKATSLLSQVKDVENQILDLESQRGFRTGELRKGQEKAMNPIQSSDSVQSGGGDSRSIYNQLRAQGVPPDEAKRQAGIR